MGRTVTLRRTCIFCNRRNLAIIPAELYSRWQGGELIQDVFPDLDEDERELLMTGTCSECWDEYMKED